MDQEQVQVWIDADREQANALEWFAAVTEDEGNAPRAAQLRSQAGEFSASADGWQAILDAANAA